MASEARSLGTAAAIAGGVGVLLLALAVVSGTVLHEPGEGADIGGGIAGLLGILLILLGTGLGIGAAAARRSGGGTR